MKKAVISIVILLLFLGSFALMHYTGAEERVYGEHTPVAKAGGMLQVVPRFADVYANWKEMGLNARFIVSYGRYLRFVEAGGGGFATEPRFPLKTRPLAGEYERHLNHENVLWVAMQNGLARKIHHVLPPNGYARKKEELLGAAGGYFSEGVYVTSYFGGLRYISDRPPRTREPVVILVDASYMAETNAPALVRGLWESGLKVDSLIFCMAEDSPDVSDDERGRLREAARLFAGLR